MRCPPRRPSRRRVFNLWTPPPGCACKPMAPHVDACSKSSCDPAMELGRKILREVVATGASTASTCYLLGSFATACEAVPLGGGVDLGLKGR